MDDASGRIELGRASHREVGRRGGADIACERHHISRRVAGCSNGDRGDIGVCERANGDGAACACSFQCQGASTGTVERCIGHSECTVGQVDQHIARGRLHVGQRGVACGVQLDIARATVLDRGDRQRSGANGVDKDTAGACVVTCQRGDVDFHAGGHAGGANAACGRDARDVAGDVVAGAVGVGHHIARSHRDITGQAVGRCVERAQRQRGGGGWRSNVHIAARRGAHAHAGVQLRAGIHLNWLGCRAGHIGHGIAAVPGGQANDSTRNIHAARVGGSRDGARRYASLRIACRHLNVATRGADRGAQGKVVQHDVLALYRDAAAGGRNDGAGSGIGTRHSKHHVTDTVLVAIRQDADTATRCSHRTTGSKGNAVVGVNDDGAASTGDRRGDGYVHRRVDEHRTVAGGGDTRSAVDDGHVATALADTDGLVACGVVHTLDDHRVVAIQVRR